MPDYALTRFNLSEHIRKHLAIYVVVIVLALSLTSLLWTMTTPRIPTDRSVKIYLADVTTRPEALDDIAADMLERTRAFDDTLMALDFESLLFAENDADYTSRILLTTRLSVGEGDVFLACPAAMDALVQSDGVRELDQDYANGWLKDYPVEPYYATVTDAETGTERTYLAGFRLDGIDALARREAFYNDGAFLAIACNSDNPATAMRAVEIMLEDLINDRAEG